MGGSWELETREQEKSVRDRASQPRDSERLPGRVRHRFPIFERLVYINSCSQGALSDSVRSSYEQYVVDWDERGSPWEYWVEQSERARSAFARVVNAAPDEIAVTTSLSAGVSALASGMRYAGKRSKIVLTDLEFPTIGQIWNAQRSRGARIEYVHPAEDGTIPLDRFERSIDEETLLVSITHVSYRTGGMLDVRRITDLAHERGAYVLLDAYQAVGSVPVDVTELGVDFLAAGALKYLLGSAGLAFLYCRRDLVERFWPTATGWFADEDIFRMDAWDYSPAATARRFEFGTPPVPSIYAGVAGMELMQAIGIEDTREHVLELQRQLIDGLADLRATIVTPRRPEQRGALICVESHDVNELVEALKREGVVTSARDRSLRISPHCYNSIEDVDALLASLARHRRLLV